MTELKIQNGDYVADGVGGMLRLNGTEALLQRVLFKLTARRGKFYFLNTLGSTLCDLSTVPKSLRLGAAKQAVAQALEDEKDLQIEQISLDGDILTVRLCYEGSALNLNVSVR